MPEILTYNGQRTIIEATADGITSKHEVPFSKAEIQAIVKAREGRNKLWTIVEELDSDVARRLYEDAPIPWASGLENRERALKEIKSSAQIYQKILENEKMTSALLDFRGIVEEIHKNLSLLRLQI